MGKIGVLPTKTSIELRDPDGDAGTIPAATTSAAGVMSAQHVRMLEEVYSAIRSGGVIEIITPSPAAPSVGQGQLDAIRQGFAGLSQRVADLERALAAPPSQDAGPLQLDVTRRLEAAEHGIAANGQQIVTVASALDGIAALVEEAHQRLAFIEGHAVASVSVETREGQAA